MKNKELDRLLAEIEVQDVDIDDIDALINESNDGDMELDALLEMDEDFLSDGEEILIHNKSIPITDEMMKRQQRHLLRRAGSCAGCGSHNLKEGSCMACGSHNQESFTCCTCNGSENKPCLSCACRKRARKGRNRLRANRLRGRAK